jgi:ribosomal protein L34
MTGSNRAWRHKNLERQRDRSAFSISRAAIFGFLKRQQTSGGDSIGARRRDR